MPKLEEILESALNLEVEERAALAERLLASLDHLSEPEAERLWGEEAARRLDAYRAGHARAIPSDEVVDRAEKLLR